MESRLKSPDFRFRVGYAVLVPLPLSAVAFYISPIWGVFLYLGSACYLDIRDGRFQRLFTLLLLFFNWLLLLLTQWGLPTVLAINLAYAVGAFFDVMLQSVKPGSDESA